MVADPRIVPHDEMEGLRAPLSPHFRRSGQRWYFITDLKSDVTFPATHPVAASFAAMWYAPSDAMQFNKWARVATHGIMAEERDAMLAQRAAKQPETPR